MKQDIQNAEDVKLLVDSFYKRVLEDDFIGFIFRDHMSLPLEKHLPVMYSFWESVLLGNPGYKGNPILSHIHLNRKVPLTESHFTIWTDLWAHTIDELFKGPTADIAKKRAFTMKQLMMYKIKQSQGDGFIQ